MSLAICDPTFYRPAGRHRAARPVARLRAAFERARRRARGWWDSSDETDPYRHIPAWTPPDRRPGGDSFTPDWLRDTTPLFLGLSAARRTGPFVPIGQ